MVLEFCVFSVENSVLFLKSFFNVLKCNCRVNILKVQFIVIMFVYLRYNYVCIYVFKNYIKWLFK